MKVFVLRLFSEVRKMDEMILRTNIPCFALVAKTCRLSKPESRLSGKVISIIFGIDQPLLFVV